MADYIKREYAVDAVADVYYNTPDINLSCEKFEAAILKIQAADVAPVIHAHWIEQIIDGGQELMCSNCGEYALMNDEFYSEFSKYCPYCGAQMDEKENDNG